MEEAVAPAISRADCEGGKQITEEFDQPILPAVKPEFAVARYIDQ